MKGKDVLVVGGGIEGVRCALEKAAGGAKVTLLEKFPTLGAERIPRDRLITPEEAFENPDLEKVRNDDNIQILPYSDIKKIIRDNGRLRANILKHSLRVDNSKCTDCKACIKVCPVNMLDDFDAALGFRTAVDYCNAGTGDYNIYKEDMPVCQQSCPANLDIRSYAGLIADKKYLDSLAVIRDRLPLPGSIGRVCPHPCETACNRQYLDEPISICFLKRYVADIEIQEGVEPHYETRQRNIPKKSPLSGPVLPASPVPMTWRDWDMNTSKYLRPCPSPGGFSGSAYRNTVFPKSSFSGKWTSSLTWVWISSTIPVWARISPLRTCKRTMIPSSSAPDVTAVSS